MSKTDDISEKLKKLDEYVQWFESDDFSLEQAVEKYAEAQKLAHEIQNNLNDLKNQITIVQKQFSKE